MKNTIIGVVILLVLAAGVYFLIEKVAKPFGAENSNTKSDNGEVVDGAISVEPDGGIGDGADPLPEIIDETRTVLGQSVEGNDITAYHFGKGSDEILFVGGTHGGYSGNTVLVAYELMDYLETNPDKVPDNVKVTIIPVLNPDGLKKVMGTTGQFNPEDVPSEHSATTPGRFNANEVDLNRNFDCEWKETGVWQSKKVSGGSEPFSEPETQAVKGYVESRDLAAAVVWYSAAGGVYSSSCKNGVSDETKKLTNTYAKASGYRAYEEFDYYAISGDMVNWFAKEGVPAISVLLTDHENTEWSKNVKGIEAVLNNLSN